MSKYEKVIQTEDLTVGYGTKIIISDINISANKGQMICLLGPNGAGKTTILRTLSGHLNPVEGKVLLFGKEIIKIKKKDLAKKLSVVLTERTDPELLSVHSMVCLGRHPHTNFWGNLTEQDEVIVEECLKLVNAYHLKDRYYSTLSDGEKQKVMIARALAQEPEVMVLDEPTSHLDVKHKVEVLSILRKMSREKGITTIISLHDVDLALKTSDIIIMVKNGEIIDWGTPDDIVKSNTISDLYDIKAAGYNHKLGCLELLCPQNAKTFVIAGGGTGISVYRILLKHNIGFYTGILYENDIDTYIADTMKAMTFIKKNTQNIEEVMSDAIKTINKCEVIIHTGYESEKEDQTNNKLLKYAKDRNKKVIYLNDELCKSTDKIDYSDIEKQVMNLF
ncbi:MAG: ABC transporter ATP-binding protein [Eubacteriaceae bacterium]